MLPGGFNDNFLGHRLITDSVRHVGEVLKTLRFHYMPKVEDWVYFKPKALFEIAQDL